MAHATETRSQLRSLYVYKRLVMEAACAQLDVPSSTGTRWKREARVKGDDWDAARSAIALGDESFTTLSRQLLDDYLVQHKAVMEQLRGDAKLDAAQKAQILASAADSFNKTMASFRRLAPELNKHAVALDALQRLAAFAQQRYPQHVPALLELIEPFGEELAKAYG